MVINDRMLFGIRPLNQKCLYIQTFGCQMNVSDSEKIVMLLRNEGFETTLDAGRADLIIVNTCSIREKAAQKVYSQLGRYKDLKEANPALIIAMGGCLAQQFGEKIFSRVPYLDLIFGTHNIHRLPELVRRVEKTRQKIAAVDFQKPVKSLEIIAVPQSGQISAYVTIMQVCNNFCSYCVVPYLRGPEESRPAEYILEEIERLADQGVKEITLLGQNVNSYGKALGGGTDFPGLLRAVGQIRGIERIRFTTSHPKDLSEALMRCFTEVDALCEHIHLPVQSGSDEILKRMNRGYTSAQYLEKVDRLRGYCPGISITSDIIVGFPGEGDDDFRATTDLMRTVHFDNLFSFKYSEREGTRALHLDDKVPEKLKVERLKDLHDLQKKFTLERNMALTGCLVEVLVEGTSKNADHEMTGRTRTNKIVNFAGEKDLVGRTSTILIKKAYLHSLKGDRGEGTVHENLTPAGRFGGMDQGYRTKEGAPCSSK
jgi:tRNA-2-methylthio-N6-dimethylallyladenosine synthase